MKHLLSLSIIIAFATLSTFAQFQTQLKGSENCSMKKQNMKNVPDLTDNIMGGPAHSFNVLDYKLDVNIYNCFLSPFPKDFKASNTITLKADSSISSIKLNAANISLQIDSVRKAGTSFTHVNNILTIQLDRTYNPGEVLQVKVCYHHKNVTSDGFFVADGMVFTDCEPEGARFWFPCWDKPSDKATLDLTVKTPATAKLGSNGKLVDSTLNGDTCTYHWVSSQNVATYLMVMTAKVNYNLDIAYWHKLSNPNDSIPLRFYYNSGETPYSMESILPAMTTYFSEKFCEHPFEKNGFAALNNLFQWGGMENQTLTSICPGCWYESLVAHEYAHQWFGDMITCATWADIWLNEGYATWSEAFWQENTGGYSAYKADMNGYAASYFQGNPGWAISVPSWATTTPSLDVLFDYSITYCKGACVLHQLRYTIGDSLFLTALQTYASDTNLKFKSATIPDFIAIVNSVTGEDYNWFFDEWIYQPNHPKYANTYNFEDLGGGQWKVNFFVTQTQTNTVFFKMPIEIKIRFEGFTDTIFRVMNDANYQQYSWVFNKRPIQFLFDPSDNILLKEESTVVGIIDEQVTEGYFRLFQNHPNPAKNETHITYELRGSSDVKLEIINIMGKVVTSHEYPSRPKGMNSIDLDCSALPSGVYSYRIKAGDVMQTKKMLITK
jgi:aminopeptidase N